MKVQKISNLYVSKDEILRNMQNQNVVEWNNIEKSKISDVFYIEKNNKKNEIHVLFSNGYIVVLGYVSRRFIKMLKPNYLLINMYYKNIGSSVPSIFDFLLVKGE